MDRATRRGAGELLAIVWDMDGTLIDSATVVPDAYIRAITRLGGPTLTREAVIAAYGLGPPAIMLAHLLGRATTDADVQEYLACLRAEAAAARPYPGIEATLEGLRGRVEMGVFTGANHAGALILLESAGLTGHFTVVVGGDEVEHQKPAPDGVLRACRSLGVAPASAAYVGDSASDLEAARSSGARAFTAGWGHLYGPDSPADLVLHRPAELLELLGACGGGRQRPHRDGRRGRLAAGRPGHPPGSSPALQRSASALSSRSISSAWAARTFSRAVGTSNHSARSTSGNSRWLPERGGHSMVKVLLVIVSASRSPGAAQALRTLPLRCRIVPSSSRSWSPSRWPVSSSSSRSAVSSGSSPWSYSPLGIDQAPRSFLAQNGPPGWTRSTSTSSPPRRYSRMPALILGIRTPSLDLHTGVRFYRDRREEDRCESGSSPGVLVPAPARSGTTNSRACCWPGGGTTVTATTTRPTCGSSARSARCW